MNALLEKPRRRMNLPVGTVSIHDGVRRIKVRMDGPRKDRWMDYALHWWRTNKGPVPEGMRVCHMDLDPLNDDPSNYGLMSAGNVIFTWHDQNPGKSEQNYRKLRAATARFNRESGLTRRALGTFPKDRWLAVDLAGRRIFFDRTWRECWQCYHAFGACDGFQDARCVRAAALGFPGFSLPDACVLSVLAEASASRADGQPAFLLATVVLDRVRAFRDARSWGPMTDNVFYIRTLALLRRPAIKQIRLGQGTEYAISAGTLQSRGPVCPITPIQGAELADPARFAGFARVTTPESPEAAA